MRKRIYLITLLGIFALTALFAAWSSNGTNIAAPVNTNNGYAADRTDVIPVQPVDEPQKSDLPDIIELHYQEIKPDSILQAGDVTSLKKTKVETLGKVRGEQINISLHSDMDNNIHGVFKHGGKEYILKYLGYAYDPDAIKIYEL